MGANCAMALVQVPFHGDILDAGKDDTGEVWVSVRRVSEAMGLAANMQIAKLKEKPWAGGMMSISPSGGGNQSTFCIPLRALPMWLATIEASRVKPELRGKLERYQREAADALAAYFFGAPQPAINVDAIVLAVTTNVRDSLRADIAAIVGNLKPAKTRPRYLQESFLEGPKHAAVINAWGDVATELSPELRSMTVADALAAVSDEARGISRARMRLHEELQRFLPRDGFESEAIRLGNLLKRLALRPPVNGRALCRLGTGSVARWGVRLVEAQKVA